MINCAAIHRKSLLPIVERVMSNTSFHLNQPLKSPASQLNSDSPDIKPDKPTGETAFVDTDTQAENVGSPVEDDASSSADLDEL